ncbi:hypothetical protein ASC75_21140 [Aminobacter sp. DSM 101952]|uniref:alpha/beta fold hydrolase n=1 Tax=Aminobacter sp. DSM 101952 TaxID=2735891 RepID=UPI0006F63C9C|nr:alpha/beta hydrolase [Aminobacter sp. DSM 101952]KQU74517.1 hypothetical protein ASC75_21140 [Aminobacter sp. DSM 101952]
MPHVNLNGQKIYYEDTGGDGPAVVFSHGFLMDHAMYHAQVETLRPRFRCLSFDQRGFGLTNGDGKPFTFWDSAQDLLDLMAHVGISKAALVGLSQGAFISMRAALLAPERVTALVLIATRSGLDTDEQNENFRQLAKEWLQNGSANVEQMLSSLLIGDERHASAWMSKWRNMERDSLVLPVNALVERDDFTPRLHEIAAPTLVVHGSNDIGIDVSHGRNLAADIKNANFVEIEGAGHAPPVTHAAETSQAIQRFLDGLPGALLQTMRRETAASGSI